MNVHLLSLTDAWMYHVDQILNEGVAVAPRNQPTLELRQHTICFDAQRPVLKIPSRKLSYQFMAAEAYWILSGDDRVETIAPYNSRIAEFSDDGERFFGAYGPKIVGQLEYVIKKLIEDPNTRQAGLTIWRENPPATKDYPCTIAIFFNIRNRGLNVHVFMRSNDVWLGLPYDAFNFAMLGHLVCAHINETRLSDNFVSPNLVYVTAASSHLYLINRDDAIECLKTPKTDIQPPTPRSLWQDSAMCLDWLRTLRDTKPGAIERWWEQP